MPGGDFSYYLALGIILFLVLVVILFVLYCCCKKACGCSWFTGCKCAKKFRRTCKKKKRSGCNAGLTVNGTGVIEEGDQEAPVLVMTFNDPPRVERPCNKWKPETVPIDGQPAAVTGFKIPCDGFYWIEYHVGMVSNGAITAVLVNGRILRRSLAWTLDVEFDELQPISGRQPGKSFGARLRKCDVISVVILPIFLDNFFIDSYPSTSDFRFFHTLSIECMSRNHGCFNDGDLITGPPIIPMPGVDSTTMKSARAPFVDKVASLREQLKSAPDSTSRLAAITATLSS